MERAFYHEHPDIMTLETEVLEARPGRLLIAVSPFFPGGGGQLADRGLISWAGVEAPVEGFERSEGKIWVLLADEQEIQGNIEAAVDVAFRRMLTQMHTYTHILNACVDRSFNGAIVTGVQMNDDGSARMDFDLPDADNEKLRALEAPINAAIEDDLPVGASYVPVAQAQAEPGLIRTRSVAPPPTRDGMIRIVEIEGLDRQACGGTHLSSTRGENRIRIVKIDIKGRHNRRVRIGFA
jgi:misacylated tRNA(Ala) deacylase